MFNVAVRQRHLELLDAVVGDVCANQPQKPEFSHPSNMHKSGVRYMCVTEKQHFKLSESFNLFQIIVRYVRSAKKHLNNICEEIIAKEFPQPNWPRRCWTQNSVQLTVI